MTRKTASDPRGLTAHRRTVLQAGLAGVAVAAGPAGVQRALAESGPAGGLYKAVFDSGYGDGAAFGREMAARGVATAAITGDVTALWYDDLYHQWKKGPAAIAGLTDRAALFCLETLAIDAGMRVVFRSEYKRSPAGLMEHRACGPQALVEAAAGLSPARSWGAGLARLVAARPSAFDPSTAIASAQACAAPGEAAQTLTAWIIAPVRRA